MSTVTDTFMFEAADLHNPKKHEKPLKPPARRRGWQHGRAAVTDGAVFCMAMDCRNAWVRRCRELINAHLADLGGEANTSVAQQSLVRRACAITTELEYLEGEFARAGHAAPCDLQLYANVAGKLHNILTTIGVQRVPRDITGAPRLADLLSKEITVRACREEDADGDAGGEAEA